MLPLVAGIETDAQLAALWCRIIEDGDEEAAAAAAEQLTRSRGLGMAREAMVQEAWYARRALSALPKSRYRTALDRLAAGIARAGLITP